MIWLWNTDVDDLFALCSGIIGLMAFKVITESLVLSGFDSYESVVDKWIITFWLEI